MKALVTGSAGFVGRHMAAELSRRKWDVVPCDILDGRDALDLFRADDTPRFDLVVHAAAREPHRVAIDSKLGTFVYNVGLDSAMLDWALRTGQHRVLYLSSSAAYPVELQGGLAVDRSHGTWVIGQPLGEDDIDLSDAAEPDAAYGWAKLTGERMAKAAAAEGLAVHVVRPFSGYGEGQAEEFPFGAFVARARRRENPFGVWGDGTQVRDWIHITDVVNGALAVVDADERRPVNLCTGEGASIADLAILVCEAEGYRPPFDYRLDAPRGVVHRVGNPGRLREYYIPHVTLTEGVKRALQ